MIKFNYHSCLLLSKHCFHIPVGNCHTDDVVEVINHFINVGSCALRHSNDDLEDNYKLLISTHVSFL